MSCGQPLGKLSITIELGWSRPDGGLAGYGIPVYPHG
jgi:hypothetical protein